MGIMLPTRHYGFILFHIITSAVHHHSLRFAGLFLRRAMPRSLLFTPLVSSLREIGFIMSTEVEGIINLGFMMFDRFWFYDVRQIALGNGMGMLPTR